MNLRLFLRLILTVGWIVVGPDVQAQAVDPVRIGPEQTVSGRVLLPAGSGSRGVEVVITVAPLGGESRDVWLLFDEQGDFSHTFRGHLQAVTVSTGLRAELYRVAGDELPRADPGGRVELGTIDLRPELRPHALYLRPAAGAPGGPVRTAMCFGPPPVGPQGEPIALGSRQFPPVELGSRVEWLLPRKETEPIYFVVERPADPGEDGVWRSGHQRVFGPFSRQTLPSELRMD